MFLNLDFAWCCFVSCLVFSGSLSWFGSSRWQRCRAWLGIHRLKPTRAVNSWSACLRCLLEIGGSRWPWSCLRRSVRGADGLDGVRPFEGLASSPCAVLAVQRCQSCAGGFGFLVCSNLDHQSAHSPVPQKALSDLFQCWTSNSAQQSIPGARSDVKHLGPGQRLCSLIFVNAIVSQSLMLFSPEHVCSPVASPSSICWSEPHSSRPSWPDWRPNLPHSVLVFAPVWLGSLYSLILIFFLAEADVGPAASQKLFLDFWMWLLFVLSLRIFELKFLACHDWEYCKTCRISMSGSRCRALFLAASWDFRCCDKHWSGSRWSIWFIGLGVGRASRSSPATELDHSRTARKLWAFPWSHP